MGDYIDKLIKQGLLTSEEAGSNTQLKPSAPGERRTTYSRSSSSSGQREFWDKFPSLRSYTSASKYIPVSKWTSAGGVVVRGMTLADIDYIYLVQPSGHMHGKLVFPKGRVEETKGETKETAAVREVAEESGILARIFPDGYLGLFDGMQSVTHFFLMLRVRESQFGHDHETEKVFCLHTDEARTELQKVNNTRDLKVLALAVQRIAEIKKQIQEAPEEAK